MTTARTAISGQEIVCSPMLQHFPEGPWPTMCTRIAVRKISGEGLDVPHVRDLRVDPEETKKVVYRPIESFGTVYMQADGWHTNAAGYGLIAQRLLDVLGQNQKMQVFLEVKNHRSSDVRRRRQ
jgi:hypothetical protein